MPLGRSPCPQQSVRAGCGSSTRPLTCSSTIYGKEDDRDRSDRDPAA